MAPGELGFVWSLHVIGKCLLSAQTVRLLPIARPDNLGSLHFWLHIKAISVALWYPWDRKSITRCVCVCVCVCVCMYAGFLCYLLWCVMQVGPNKQKAYIEGLDRGPIYR